MTDLSRRAYDGVGAPQTDRELLVLIFEKITVIEDHLMKQNGRLAKVESATLGVKAVQDKQFGALKLIMVTTPIVVMIVGITGLVLNLWKLVI